MEGKHNRGTLIPSKISHVKPINTSWHIPRSPCLLHIVVVLTILFLLPNSPASVISVAYSKLLSYVYKCVFIGLFDCQLLHWVLLCTLRRLVLLLLELDLRDRPNKPPIPLVVYSFTYLSHVTLTLHILASY